MYLGALGIRLFRGLGVSGCGIFDGVVRTDVDNVEDTFDPGEIGNFELEDWVGELVPPLELLLALALLTWLILETGLAIRGPKWKSSHLFVIVGLRNNFYVKNEYAGISKVLDSYPFYPIIHFEIQEST